MWCCAEGLEDMVPLPQEIVCDTGGEDDRQKIRKHAAITPRNVYVCKAVKLQYIVLTFENMTPFFRHFFHTDLKRNRVGT